MDGRQANLEAVQAANQAVNRARKSFDDFCTAQRVFLSPRATFEKFKLSIERRFEPVPGPLAIYLQRSVGAPCG